MCITHHLDRRLIRGPNKIGLGELIAQLHEDLRPEPGIEFGYQFRRVDFARVVACKTWVIDQFRTAGRRLKDSWLVALRRVALRRATHSGHRRAEILVNVSWIDDASKRAAKLEQPVG